jgi:hypothetical protein
MIGFDLDNPRLKSETKMVDSWVRMGFGVINAIWLRIGVENRSNPKVSLWLFLHPKVLWQCRKIHIYPNSLNV